jgi:hypothetical protein
MVPWRNIWVLLTMIDSDTFSLPCLHVSCARNMSMLHFSMTLVMMSSVSSAFKPLKFCTMSLSLVPSLAREREWLSIMGLACLFVSLLLGPARSKWHYIIREDCECQVEMAKKAGLLSEFMEGQGEWAVQPAIPGVFRWGQGHLAKCRCLAFFALVFFWKCQLSDSLSSLPRSGSLKLGSRLGWIAKIGIPIGMDR